MSQHTRRGPSVNPSEPSDNGPPPDGEARKSAVSGRPFNLAGSGEGPPAEGEPTAEDFPFGANSEAPPQEDTPTIPHEEIDEEITPGAGGTLSIPREETGEEDSGEEELGGASVKIRKPGRREFIIMNSALEWPAKLIVHKPKGEGSADEEYYYVAPELRSKIEGELKGVRVFLYYSVIAHCCGLWLVKVTLDNRWYESLQDRLFRQPPEFFDKYEVRVYSDKAADRYRVKRRARTVQTVRWPDRPIGDLLGEALGPGRIIRTPDHPLYQDLTSGEEVE
jgi:hypothetical protein